MALNSRFVLMCR